MYAPQIIETVNGIRVAVPDDLSQLTPYVLREQGDWFEDEICFVRQLLLPDDNVIDIGANFGLYTLSMAKAVGSHGRVWSFEPTSTTSAYLLESVALNGFSHVTVDRRGVSSGARQARLALHASGEVNAIVGDEDEVPCETIACSSLDLLAGELQWQDIDFLKIDAEGQELQIIEGGGSFFRNNSPLIQFEVRAGRTLHLELVDAFSAIGYVPYRLVPGLGVLVPFDQNAPIDGYLLNLFCCQAGKAAYLAERGLLVTAESLAKIDPERLLLRWNRANRLDWERSLKRFPYAKVFAGEWRRCPRDEATREVERALSLHALSRLAEAPPAARYIALRASYQLLEQICRQNAGRMRLASMARVASELGERSLAVSALDQLTSRILNGASIDAGEPFLAVSEHFDSVDPRSSPGNWIVGTALEALEKASAHSSYFLGDRSRQRLTEIIRLGFGSEEMDRRLNLIEQCFAAPAR